MDIPGEMTRYWLTMDEADRYHNGLPCLFGRLSGSDPLVAIQ